MSLHVLFLSAKLGFVTRLGAKKATTADLNVLRVISLFSSILVIHELKIGLIHFSKLYLVVWELSPSG